MSIKINCIGNNFSYTTSSTLDKIPKHIIWIHNQIESDITFFLDQNIIDSPQNFNSLKGKKFGWLLESRCLNIRPKTWIVNNLELCKGFFRAIFTCDKELLDLDELFCFLPAYGTYIDEFLDHKKTQLVSMVTSNKNFAPYHQFRINFAQKYSDCFDLYGRGFNEIDKKEKALNSYMFSVAIENDLYDRYYTEKLIDCFATKTIPVYLGSLVILPFNELGVIRLTKEFDFSFLTEELYHQYLPYIEKNFEISKQFYCLEDYLWQEYSRLLIKES